MKLLTVDPRAPDESSMQEAATVIRHGGLVAFPTETVYGLGANALDAAAVRKIFAVKGRPSFNPLIVHVGNLSAARALVTEWPSAAERLAERFWPGPLTVVLPKRPTVPDLVTAGLSTVALRVPAHPVASALLRLSGLPIAAPSANRYTSLSPTMAVHVVRGLGDAPEIVIDGGPTAVGIESAVIDLSGAVPVLLRPGSIPVGELEAVLGPVRGPGELAAEAPRPSPGMVDRHYSPRARLILVGPEVAPPHDQATTTGAEEGVVGALVLSGLPVTASHSIRMPLEPLGYARGLYAALHELDELGCTTVYVELPPESPAWGGVVDRLRRAASPAS